MAKTEYDLLQKSAIWRKGFILMEMLELKPNGVVRWDTYTNKVYFNVEKDSFKGRLIIEKTADGKIGMRILRGEFAMGNR
jgi:hypothetical protein